MESFLVHLRRFLDPFGMFSGVLDAFGAISCFLLGFLDLGDPFGMFSLVIGLLNPFNMFSWFLGIPLVCFLF